MWKSLFILLSLLYTFTSQAQDIVLLKNFNPKVKDLKHDLNSKKDSLVLISEEQIAEVEIFNEDFEKSLIIQNHSAKIPLEDLPIGRFEVEIKLSSKIVLMNLIRFDKEVVDSKMKVEHLDIHKEGMMLDENLKPIKSRVGSLEHLLSKPKAKKKIHKKFFWIIYEINSRLGSNKIMKLVDKGTAHKLIEKNKLEVTSNTAKFNELTIWEVYDTSQFMKNQVSNPDFVFTANSETFNKVPYYQGGTSLKTP